LDTVATVLNYSQLVCILQQRSIHKLHAM